MANEKIRGNKVLIGSHAEVWIDGDKVWECNKIEAKVTINREDQQFGMDIDSTMTGLKGEFTIGIKKVFSRWNKYLEEYKKGIDRRVEIIAKLKDPNARNSQMERYSIGNCWFNELPIIIAEMGAPIEEEISGGFTVSDLVALDLIS